ncbi:unnamed protein product [Blepharisma stoltei]|uniref:Uncharacterized protein n=1 Tax=Blepharisma stoltei TaxID=1481888 RepID=A0AAU9KF55_9CILI|nr:unnamed protein product [Blepharisma stoltei]
MMAQSAGPIINSFKELYYIVKRNFGKDVRSNPIKLAKKANRIDLNNLGDFFGNETIADVGENQNFTQISNPN